ncbi:MAG: PAS domain S-box protein [Bacteroidales bacterium]|nr:PAS domain S-box protein [Bacteroidales bacterium]
MEAIISENREYCHATLFNISEQFQERELLKKSEHQKNLILEAAGEGILGIDQQGVFTFVNPMSLQILGYKPEEILGKDSHLVFHHHYPDGSDYPKEKCPIEMVIISGKPSYGEEFFWRKEGTGFHVEYSCLPIMDENRESGAVLTFRDITQRKQYEAELLLSEERYRSLFHNNHSVILLIDPEAGLIIDANNAACNFYGWSHDCLCKKSISDITDSSSLNRLEAKDLFREGNEKRNLFRHRLSDGQIRDVEVFFSPIELKLIKLLYYQVNDVTDQKQIEDALQLSEEKYALAFQLAPYAITFTSLDDGKFKEVNSAFLSLTGYSKEDLLAESVNGFIIWADINDLSSLVSCLLDGKEVSGKEFVFRKKNGDNFTGLFSARIIHIEKKPYLYSSIEDISLRKESERALINAKERTEHSEGKFRQIIQSQAEGIGFVNQDEVFEFANPASEKIFETETGSLIGASLYDFLIEGEIELINKQTRKRKKGIADNYELQILTRKGNFRTIHVSATPKFDDNDDYLGAYGVFTDITERKKAERQIKEKSAILTNLLINLQEGILLEDSERRILLTNQLFCSMFGIPLQPEDLIGADCSDSAEQSKALFKDQDRFIRDIHKILTKKKAVFNDELELVDGRFFERDYIPTYIEGIYNGHLWKYRDITQRKNSSIFLQRSEERFRQVVEQSLEVVWEVDSAGVYTYVSPLSKAVYGHTPEEMIGHMSFYDQYPVEHREKLRETAFGVFGRKECFTGFVNPIIRSDGKKVILSTNGMPLIDKDGILTGYRGLDADITERIISEEKLMQQNDRLNAIIRAMPDLIFIFDKKGTYIEFYCSQPEKLLVPEHQIIGANIGKIFDQETTAFHLQKINDCITHNSLITYEYSAITAGALTYFESRLAPLGKDRVLAFIRDISGQKQAEFEIRDLNANLEYKISERTAQLADTNRSLKKEIDDRIQAEEALRIKTNELENFFSVALDLLCITDTSGNFIKVNKAWSDILGFSTTELETRKFLEFVHPDDVQSSLDSLSRLSEQKPVYNLIIRIKSKDGNYHFVEWHSVPVGKIVYAAARDITQRKRAEDFEYELLQLSPKLTGISPSGINSALSLALSRIGRFLDADRAYIFEYDPLNHSMSNTHEWCNEGIFSGKENLQNLKSTDFRLFEEILQKHEIILIQSVNDLPENWKAERKLLKSKGIKSMILIPMLTENDLIGFVGLDSVVDKKEYNAPEINIMKVWSSMLASLIRNQRTENLLEQTRQNYETFFNTIDDFLFVLDNDGNIIHTNNSVTNRLGFSENELYGKSVLFVHPEERREEAARIVGDMLAGTIDFCPVPLITKSGSQLPVETRVIPGFWDGKQVLFGVSKDVSKIKLSEEKFSKAFHSNSALMAISGFENGVFIDVNDTFLQTLGYTRDEVIGKTSFQVEIFSSVEVRDSIVRKIKKNELVREVELEVRTKSGTNLVGLFSAESIFVGKELCLLTVMVDITVRKQAEREISKARNEAEKANLAKSEFLSRMSHELRTPMNSILGFAQLLQMSELNTKQKTGVGYILSSGKHLLDLINEVLDISRIEAGHLSLSMEPIRLYAIIYEVIDTLSSYASENNITIGVGNMPKEELFVIADRKRLKQILLNLLNNALKYNKTGGSVNIKCERFLKPGGNIPAVRISIKDTGSGIADEDIPRLFMPFERINADKTGIEGTGLGLSVVKKLLDAMGGSIGIESEKDSGSTFWFELPEEENHAGSSDKSDGYISGFGFI